MTITRYKGNETDLVIPSRIDGKKVSKIEGNIGSLKVSVFFPNTRMIHSVTIEEGIISIGDRAFMECRNLSSASIPESVKEIGKEAFIDCSLLELVFPQKIPSIGEYAFTGIKGLGIPYKRIPIEFVRFMCERLQLNLIGEDQKTITRLYLPRPGLWSKRNPYIDFVRLFSKREVIDLSEYDDLFLSQEKMDIFDNCYVALMRLRYPYQLLEKHRAIYMEYFQKNKHLFIPTLIRKRKLEEIKGLAELDLICRDYLELYIEEARDHSRNDILDVLQRHREKVRNAKTPEKEKKSTPYSPEDWVFYEDCIQAYKGNRLVVTFPSDIGGQQIRRIEADNLGVFGDHSDYVISVIIEEGIELIGEIIDEDIEGSHGRVFRNCVNLKHVHLPSSIRKIHSDAFWGYKKIIIHAPKGSYAIKFAKENDIKYVET